MRARTPLRQGRGRSRRLDVSPTPWAGTSVLVAVTLALSGVRAPAAAQQDCQWLAPSGDFVREGTLNRTRVRTPNLWCPDGVRIRADSARFYDTSDFYELYGNVRYEDPDRILRAQRAQYYRSTGRLQAQQDVRLTRRSDNALITGETLVYTEGPGGSSGDVLTVTGGRPHAVLYVSRDTARSTDPRPDTAAAAAPWEVDADRIEIRGEDRFEASGDVEIVRDSLEAFSDRAVYDPGAGGLTLLGRARMVDAGYELRGDTIAAALPEDVIREIEARSRAVLTGEDLDVRAPRIRMLMTDGALERMVAVTDAVPDAPDAPDAPDDPDIPVPDPRPDELGGAPPPPMTDAALLQAEHPLRPVARARDFVIVADSVDVRLPGEVLERLVAVGDAHGETSARDSLGAEGLPEIARRDWIEGQTIEALFSRAEPAEPAPAEPDTADAGYRLESLTAGGSARSLYRMAARDTAAAAVPSGGRRPAVHYVTGDTIVLTLNEGEIRMMDVVGQVRGIHWEPVGRPGVVPDTSGAAVPDTAAGGGEGASPGGGGTPDTSGAVRSGGGRPTVGRPKPSGGPGEGP